MPQRGSQARSRVRPSGRNVLVLAALGAFALGAAALQLRLSSHHGDGDGPLGSLGYPGQEALGTDPATGVREWTYGVRLCVVDPTSPVTLISVEPTRQVGDGFATLGMYVRQFVQAPSDHPIIGVEGFPPPNAEVPDRLERVEGFEVSAACSNRIGGTYDELLVGLGITKSSGGGWNGISVRYEAGPLTRVLDLDHDLLVCGSSVAADPAVAEYCDSVVAPLVSPVPK
jgi:hypothetical protein